MAQALNELVIIHSQFQFAANDAVRFSGLQTAYITHNEHPTGSKDQRDCAAGDEAKAE